LQLAGGVAQLASIKPSGSVGVPLGEPRVYGRGVIDGQHGSGDRADQRADKLGGLELAERPPAVSSDPTGSKDSWARVPLVSIPRGSMPIRTRSGSSREPNVRLGVVAAVERQRKPDTMTTQFVPSEPPGLGCDEGRSQAPPRLTEAAKDLSN